MKLIMLVFVAAFIVVEFAPVALGRSCKLGWGMSYRGTMAHGFSYYGNDRRKCTNWTFASTKDRYLSTHWPKLGEPPETYEEAKNYCRLDYCRSENMEYLKCDLPRCTGPCQSGNGIGYLGTVNKTKDGKACKNWKDIEDDILDNQFPDVSKEAAKNYCRNPNDRKGPWCYVDDDKTTKYCDVPPCIENCQIGNGVGYTGKVYKTNTGKECKYWETHAENWPEEKFPDGNKEYAYDYCRNLDNDPKGPWCYTGDDKDTKEYCDIPKCPRGIMPFQPFGRIY